MSRRLLLATAGLSLLVGTTGADAEHPPVDTDLPRPNCIRRLVDNPDDSFVNPTGNAAANLAPLAVSGLDIISVFARSTADEIGLFMKLKDIPTDFPKQDQMYRYNFELKVNGKTHTLRHALVSKGWPSAAGKGGHYPGTAPAINGLEPNGKIDPDTDFVYVLLPRALYEGAAGIPLPDGVQLEIASAFTEWMTPANDTQSVKADTLTPAADQKMYTLGDNYCFGPPPAALSDVATPGTQFSDVTNLSAKLVDEAGAALANQTVTFTIGTSAPVSATTNASGVATTPYTAALAAGTYPVTVRFAGTPEFGAATATGSITIKVEGTKMAALTVKKTSATVRTVTAALTDDDGAKLAGQKVTWYVNGKAASTLTTDASGKSVFKAKPKQSVQAKFLGVAGKYTASASNVAKTN